jgi:hypothetical protein
MSPNPSPETSRPGSAPDACAGTEFAAINPAASMSTPGTATRFQSLDTAAFP